jgi:hypothetical protein
VASFAGLTVDKPGSGFTLQINGGSLTGATTGAFTVTPAAASQLVISTQPSPNLTAGARFGLTVSVEDPFGNPATSYNGPVTISLSENAGAGALTGSLTATASDGVATFSGLALDTAASGYTIEASGPNLVGATSSSIAVAPAPAAKLVVSIPPPSSMTAGAGFGLAITADDPYGNIATSFTGNITIALASHPDSATLNGEPLTDAATSGVVNFRDLLILDTAAQGYTIRATSDGLTPVTTSAITVTSLPATHLVVVTQPPSVLVPGGSFGLVVAAEDPFGNIDPTFGGRVSVGPAGDTGATVAGSTSVTASNGLASFTGLTMSPSGAAVSLNVTSAGLTGTSTNPVNEPTPAQLAFAVGSVTVDENTRRSTRS